MTQSKRVRRAFLRTLEENRELREEVKMCEALLKDALKVMKKSWPLAKAIRARLDVSR